MRVRVDLVVRTAGRIALCRLPCVEVLFCFFFISNFCDSATKRSFRLSFEISFRDTWCEESN